jgi:NAD(P)-dependent dehydrogenase (short-subunit alcohol dehydrogenase family)
VEVGSLEHMTTDASPADDASAQRPLSTVGEDEQGLREAVIALAEHIAADWASSNLAVVIQNAGDAGWAATAEKHRERATMMLAVRLFHAIRATMAVLGTGYEVEGRAMARLVLETRARLLEVTKDASQETGRRWLERA